MEFRGIYPKQFTFFDDVCRNNTIRYAFNTMQSIYVFRTEDRIEFDAVTKSLQRIKLKLKNNSAWIHYPYFQ